jgi:predicted  nucleic acid-binding Zn-ribbon protein
VSDLQLLYQVQELDLQIEARRRALQEIEESLGESGELASARAQVTRLQELLQDQQRQLRDLDWNVEEISRRAKEDEEKLYSGAIRNPKELEGLRRELEQRQERRRQLEDRELQLMAEIEETQAELRQAESELAHVQSAVDAQHRELRARQAEVTEHLARLGSERTRLAATIAAANLAQYEQLRRTKRGLAISKVERSTCQGCRIALPMGLVQRVRAGRDFVFCPSCGRILYA